MAFILNCVSEMKWFQICFSNLTHSSTLVKFAVIREYCITDTEHHTKNKNSPFPKRDEQEATATDN